MASPGRTENLKPFQPGQSGNPGGRAKGLARRVRELVGDDGVELAEAVLDVLRDPSSSNKDRMEAASWLADRGWGRPTQTISGPDGGPLEVETRHVQESIERFAASVLQITAVSAADEPAGAADSD